MGGQGPVTHSQGQGLGGPLGLRQLSCWWGQCLGTARASDYRGDRQLESSWLLPSARRSRDS